MAGFRGGGRGGAQHGDGGGEAKVPDTLLLLDESSLKMDHVAHVPQSPASHVGGFPPQGEPSADMLHPDPRDTFFLSEREEAPEDGEDGVG